MSDEQRVILQMVSEGKITAEDGVKLLEALGKGEEKRRERSAPSERARLKKNILLRTMGDRIPDIGHMVRDVMHEAMGSIGADMCEPDIEFNEFEGEGGSRMEDVLEIEEGTELVLKPSRSALGGGDVTLRGVSGSACRVVSGDPLDVRVYRDDRTVWLRWGEGDLEMEVPETVSRATVDIMGGDLVADGLLSRVRLRSKGGEITIREAAHAFDAKTMGGNMAITLTSGWEEDSRISTMGGDISIGVPSGLNASVSASSFGGEVIVEEGIGSVTESGKPGSSRARVDIGSPGEGPILRVKTMGGNVRIGRTVDFVSDEAPVEVPGGEEDE